MNKYRNKKVSCDGYSFASALESAVFSLLKLRENNKEIKILQVQDHVYLTNARILYIPDFKCFDLTKNEEFWVEAKGMELPQWRIKRKLWQFYGPGYLQIYKGTAKRPFLHETLEVKPWPTS